MSDTAKELREKLRSARFSEALHDVAQRAIARAAQLERGIERANDQAVKCLGGWADMGPATVAPVSYDTLLQLIEELGNE